MVGAVDYTLCGGILQRRYKEAGELSACRTIYIPYS